MFAASTILYKMLVCLSESRGGSSFGESIFSYCGQRYCHTRKKRTHRDAGTGGQEGQPAPLPFTRRGKLRGAKVPFQFKGLPWRNSELSEMLVQLFYEFASENARNAVI